MKRWFMRTLLVLIAAAGSSMFSPRLSAPTQGGSTQEPMPQLPVLSFPYSAATASSFTSVKLYNPVTEAAPAFASDAAAADGALAKHEPLSGAYLGMLGADKRVGFQFERIESVYGRKHAIYLTYVGWRKLQTDTNTYFPKRVADRVKALGGALQIGWEPRYGLNDVQDDEYVRRFAREAKESGIPIFLRYASEMNGPWVPWHGDPKLFIEKFRLIHRIMAEEAPNVAMVWAPNSVPAANIDEYYPGDDAVDWVGFSLYTGPTTFEDKLDLDSSLLDTFAPLYAKYSKKPIMISEGAVVHTLLPDNTSYTEWAVGQLDELYAYLPRLFPQVKAFTYFNNARARSERANSKYVYDLGENAAMDAAYQQHIQSPLFLSQVRQGMAAPGAVRYEPLEAGSGLPAGRHELLAYTRLKDGAMPHAFALYRSDGQLLDVSYERPWRLQVDISADEALRPVYAVAFDNTLAPMAVQEISAK
ncbi:glycoside hydrolase family 26 protein [Paenibacillus chartarius]|uniref:Glycoside hydrolase family 26 protein n=1 Tax=Paenibacillus chartarius TaxID=747481 RepID=A0ABV6DQP9_9BACL